MFLKLSTFTEHTSQFHKNITFNIQKATFLIILPQKRKIKEQRVNEKQVIGDHWHKAGKSEDTSLKRLSQGIQGGS